MVNYLLQIGLLTHAYEFCACLYINSEGKKCFGCILKVHDKNMVTIRSIRYGKAVERESQVRVLVLLYRNKEWNNE